MGQRSRSKKKRRRPSFVEKELNKNLVLIEFLGHSSPEVQVLYDYYKLNEGSLSFTMSMTEAEIRKKIASLIREKKVFLMIMRPLVTIIWLLFAA